MFERTEESLSRKLLPFHAGITTKAVKDRDEYVITGGKMWTTNGAQADWMCLLANTSDGAPHRNKSLICLPMNLPGRPPLAARAGSGSWTQTGNWTLAFMAERISFFLFVFSNIGVHIARRIDKLGMRSSDTAEVFFDDVRVPCKNIIGQEGLGFTYQMLQFQEERLWAAANSE